MFQTILTFAVFACTLSADMLLEVPTGSLSGPTIGGPTSQYLYTSWTQAGVSQGATIRANFFANTPNQPIDVWLTQHVGPGTPAGSEFAHATVNAPTAPDWVTLFSNITLGSGTWYLVATSSVTDNVMGWSNGNNNPTTAPGITFNGHHWSGGFLSNTANPLASNFAGTYPSLAVTIRGTFIPDDVATPEPATLALVGLALIGFSYRKKP